VIDINLKGSFNFLQAAGSVMMKQRHGSIINMASISGVMGNPGQVNYSASKAGVIGMTKAAAKELGRRHIRVNAIAPGFFSTNQNKTLLYNPDGSLSARSEKIISHTPLRRFGTTDDLTGSLLFLADETYSAFVTGVIIPIDGGFSAYAGV
ncbi:MAG: SDR family oxidoreductase, partial [Clostridia bacterium]|nr:SDR family oxidoreductase [Clostridia bacterium]